jgi:hypothetical protein
MGIQLGFRFSENMYGSYRPVKQPAGERRFRFHFDVVSRDLWKTLRDGRAQATGTVEAEDLATQSPLEGFIVIKPLVTRLIRYEFDFTGDDGVSYHYAGEKTIRHLHPITTWTTLPGAIYDADAKEFARSVTRFDLGELLPFLRSFRPSLGSR